MTENTPNAFMATPAARRDYFGGNGYHRCMVEVVAPADDVRDRPHVYAALFAAADALVVRVVNRWTTTTFVVTMPGVWPVPPGEPVPRAQLYSEDVVNDDGRRYAYSLTMDIGDGDLVVVLLRPDGDIAASYRAQTPRSAAGGDA